MPSGGMSNETTNCSNFTSIGTKKTNISLSNGTYVTASSNTLVSVKMSTAISNAIVVYLGSNSASINTSTTTDYTYDVFGVYWK